MWHSSDDLCDGGFHQGVCISLGCTESFGGTGSLGGTGKSFPNSGD